MEPAHPPAATAAETLRLHVGSGRRRLEGWINLDIQLLPGVDVVADVRHGLLFSGVEAIFAEHFLEHLEIDAALDFLFECHRALRAGGWLRLSTPNLDWVWATHYRLEGTAEYRRHLAIALNRAFYGWRHRFLWNREMLGVALAACGFSELAWQRYGESGRPELRGLEGHEISPDAAGLHHVLVVEAVKGEPRPDDLAALRSKIDEEFLSQMTD